MSVSFANILSILTPSLIRTFVPEKNEVKAIQKTQSLKLDKSLICLVEEDITIAFFQAKSFISPEKNKPAKKEIHVEKKNVIQPKKAKDLDLVSEALEKSSSEFVVENRKVFYDGEKAINKDLIKIFEKNQKSKASTGNCSKRLINKKVA